MYGGKMKQKGVELLKQEAIKSIEFLIKVREGEEKGGDLSHRITAAKILIDKVFPPGGLKETDQGSALRIEVVDLTREKDFPA
jgi:hypothetical protein